MSKERFDWKSFIRAVLTIAIPVALQNLLTTTGSMVDTMMLAPLGENVVGSVGLCAQFSSLMFSCYWGFVGGGMLFFGQYWGAKDHDGVNRSFGLTATCMMIVAAVFCVLATCFPHLVMRLYTDKTVLHDIGIDYLRIVGFSYPLMIFSMALSAMLRSTEKVKIPMYGAFAAVGTNMFMNWVLIYGKFGLPAMGVRGAALATVIAQVVNLSVILIQAKVKRDPFVFSYKKHFIWTKESVREYFIKCFPIICNELFLGVANMIINIILGRQSVQAIAATAVFRTLEGFVIGFFAGFSNAASVLVGKEVGAGNLELAYQRAKRMLILCDTAIFGACLFLLAIHKPLFTAMSLSGESFTICTGMLCIYSVVALIRMCNWTTNDTYRSAGDAAYGTILEITFMYLMVLPCVYFSGIVFKAPYLIIFACCFVDEPIRFTLMIRHLISGKWVKPVTPQGRDALPAFLASRGKKNG